MILTAVDMYCGLVAVLTILSLSYTAELLCVGR